MWTLMEMVHRPDQRVRWLRVRETALENLELILGEQAFRTGCIPKIPKGYYKKVPPKRAGTSTFLQ